jgi:hypothetical protein
MDRADINHFVSGTQSQGASFGCEKNGENLNQMNGATEVDVQLYQRQDG